MRNYSLSIPTLVFAVFLIQGCATTEGSERRGSSDLITQEEIQGASVGTAFEVVEQLRPRWLRTRGRTSIRNPEAGLAWVYVDGVRFGRIEDLHQLSRDTVIEMRRLSASQAQTRFGTDHDGGAILVVTRR